ncbi:MAG TPA: response regulator [Thermoanaerobaculia bacterium]|nr:response regulator [Thermoanaerobaculia bacterium]
MLRILVADDQAVNRKLTMRQLEQLGFAVDVVSNGREAVDAAARDPYDLIFMDCHMPQMDGFEATREIRQREGTSRRTPVIALTASLAEQDRGRCLAAGMDDYLVKPVSKEALIRILGLWLTETAIDNGAIERLQQIDPSVLREVIDLYISDAPLRIASIRDAVARADAQLLASAAHALKGSSGNAGAKRVQEICSDLEKAGRAGALNGAPALLDQLESEYQRAVGTLRRLRER